jgi:hypothetical protein
MKQQPDLTTELIKRAQLAGVWGQENIRSAVEFIPQIPDEKARQEKATWLLTNLDRMAVARGAEAHPFLPYPDADAFGNLQNGAVLLGFVDTLGNEPACPVGIPLDSLTVHMLVAGPTGKGKSTFVVNLLAQLAAAGIPMWIFDTVGEYADLLPALADGVTVVRFADFRRNPFQGPSNITQEEWLRHMANYMREAFFFRDGVINLFRDVCKRVLESGREPNARTFAAEILKVPHGPFRLLDYYASLERFAASLELPPYCCATGFDLVGLSRRAVVFDLRHISADHRLSFITDLLTWQDAWREYDRDPKLEMVVVLDELSHFYSKEAAARSDLGEPFVLQMLKGSRKKGIATILADQTYAQFHEVIRSNCQTKIAFETVDGVSRLEIARDFGLNPEQQLFLREMSFGQENRRVLVQLATFPQPFLMTVPHIEKPAKRTAYTPPDFRWTPLPETAPEEARKRPERDEITHEMERYLATIACNPFYMLTQYDRMIEDEDKGRKKKRTHNKPRGTFLRKRLTDLGLLIKHEIPTGILGGQRKIPLPTQAGYEYLSKRGIGFTIPEGNGSVQHKCWQHWISRKLQKDGWKTEIEMILRSKQVDVGAVKPGLLDERTAFEVVWDDNLDKELSNLEKDLEDGWPHITFCVLDDETRQKLNALLPDGVENVEIKLLKEFL